MSAQPSDEDRLKSILREVVVEVLDQRRDWFTTVVAEAMDTVLRQQLQLDETTKQQARQRFERHFGTLPAHSAGSADNEQIDADLAQIYAATGEQP